MKTILMAAVLTLSQVVMANSPIVGFQPETIVLAKGSQTLTPIKGEEISREAMCANEICILNGTTVKVRFRLGGCMDTLSNVTSLVDYASRTVYVSAQRVGNKKSMTTMCLVEPTAVVDLQVYNLDGDFEIRYLGAEEVLIPM